jgi:hypothetical protein
VGRLQAPVEGVVVALGQQRRFLKFPQHIKTLVRLIEGINGHHCSGIGLASGPFSCQSRIFQFRYGIQSHSLVFDKTTIILCFIPFSRQDDNHPLFHPFFTTILQRIQIPVSGKGYLATRLAWMDSWIDN